MEKIAIKLMVGKSPTNYVCGCEYYFGIESNTEYICHKCLEKDLKKAIEDCLEKKFGDNPIQLMEK